MGNNSRGYFRVKNWDEFQHYKDRNPPWIKLYNTLINDYSYVCLQDDTKLHLIHIFLYASQHENKIPADEEFLSNVLNVNSQVRLKPLLDNGFIEMLSTRKHDDSDMQQSPYTEERRGEQSKEEESRETPREKSIIPANIGEDTRTPAEKLGTQLKKIHESIQTVPYPIKPGERNKIARLQEDFSDDQLCAAWRYFLENINQFKTRQNGSVSIHWFYEKIGDIAQAMLEEKKQQETGGVPF